MQPDDIRKKLHTLAETAHKEKETAAFVVQVLHEAGVTDIREGIGGYGIVAILDSGKKGPSVLFRAELDALPIAETLTLPYGSRNGEVSHKCGHDGHMAILLGLAQILQRHPIRRGKVYFLFQPAEETGEGASLMLEDKRMADIAPDRVFALHNLPGYDLNSVLLRDGVFAAGSWGLIIRLTGNTAHAAHPENAKSPASAVASLIQDLQSLPRTMMPFDRAGLVTVIHARLGERAFGTTPGFAEVMATIRAHEPEDLEKLGNRSVEIAGNEADKWGLKMKQEWTERFQPTSNDPDAVALVEKVATGLAASGEGKNNQVVRRLPKPFSWSEDFGRFTESYPGALIGLGAGTQQPQLHDTQYDFPNELLETGQMLFNGIINAMGLR